VKKRRDIKGERGRERERRDIKELWREGRRTMKGREKKENPCSLSPWKWFEITVETNICPSTLSTLLFTWRR
jgi:hypothetical protein